MKRLVAILLVGAMGCASVPTAPAVPVVVPLPSCPDPTGPAIACSEKEPCAKTDGDWLPRESLAYLTCKASCCVGAQTQLTAKDLGTRWDILLRVGSGLVLGVVGGIWLRGQFPRFQEVPK